MSKKEKKNKQADPETVTEETVEAVAEETEAVEPEVVEETAEPADETAAELAELKDSYLRLMAEYDNFRKRTAKEREQIFVSAKANAVEALLPVYDNLERAAAQPTDDEAYKKGVEMTLAQLVQSLAGIGVTIIESEPGTAFDPEKHNAVMHVEDDALGENVIAETFQKGFETDSRVIRHAVVKVAN